MQNERYLHLVGNSRIPLIGEVNHDYTNKVELFRASVCWRPVVLTDIKTNLL